MKTLFRSLQLGLHFLVHPRQSVDELQTSQRAGQLAWTFLLLNLTLWSLLTLYVNIVNGITSRGREMLLNISFGPDIFVSLLTLPLGVVVVALAAFLFSKISARFGGTVTFKFIFYILAFTLCAGSLFFDFPHELYMAISPDPWVATKTMNGLIYGVVIMFGPILWSLIVTVISLAYATHLTTAKTILAFFITVLPIFASLIFIVM